MEGIEKIFQQIKRIAIEKLEHYVLIVSRFNSIDTLQLLK